MKRQSDGNERRRRLAWDFYSKQQEAKRAKDEVDHMKPEFEAEMDNFFNELGAKRVAFDGDQSYTGCKLFVRKVERTSIEWNADRLEQRIPKKLAKQIIKKKYCIDNMHGLTEYLKSCGVDPKVFKKFLRIERTVDQKEVDRLSELGQLTVRDINGCYYVSCQKPYFTLSVKRAEDDGNE